MSIQLEHVTYKLTFVNGQVHIVQGRFFER